MNEDQIQDTAFDCKLCGSKITFNVNDSSSFLSLSDKKQFAGMTLTTYRVAHKSNNEYHTNAITVDHKGFWRGYVDAYVDHDIKRKASKLAFLTQDNEPLKSSTTFEFLALIHQTDGWVLDIVCPASILPIKIGETILLNLESIETDLLEEGMLLKLDMAIGDKTFQTYLLGDLIITFILKNEEEEDFVQELFDQILASPIVNDVEKLNPDAFKTIVQVIDAFPNKALEVENLVRLMEEGTTMNPLKIQNPGKITQLVKSVINQKSYPDYLAVALISLLSGQRTIVELIKTGYLKDFQRIFEIIDFVKLKI